MKTGYDQFFKKAQTVAQTNSGPSVKVAKKSATSGMPKDRRLQSADAKKLGRELASELRQRVSPKYQQATAKKNKKGIPWKLVSISMMGLCVTALGLWKMEKIEKIIRSVEITMLGQAYAEDTKPAESAEKVGEKSAEKVAEKTDAEKPAEKKEFTSEEINHLSKLNDRKRELDSREEELNRVEAELTAQKAELEKRMAELESTRKNISTVLEEKVQSDDKKVDKLVEMYSNMKPQQSAKVFEEMDEGLAIEILGRMKKKNVAEIMSLVKSEKVKVLSEKFAGYKRN